ncbi:uncharacterized protein N7473_011193 [Penicillium subrubescens]|uniref:uncharacterized protein n=1 Tax=Penicillium subrubescens TaxID=1316194 RepID=UPI0025457DD1|nr:uncharacterized protein N7473_013119 [Penicillium subrubescens]XP_057004254.1 uncharacterized protein N7473_011193 [Penicillium subrubescens]KAJ5875006.1 hypothetical protein N7473_013119 [Penicillium subrubescens]KAJ5882759.1 hypothetical protein N7473_011193 [Penicillium subrubescens]
MSDNLALKHAFDIEVQVDKYSEGETDLDQQTKNLNFTIVGGSITPEETFTPRIKSTSITGIDEATLSYKEKILHLKVTAEALIDHEMASGHETGFRSKVQLTWYGDVKLGKDEDSILYGNFTGETQLGNPIACFRLDGKSEEFAGLKNRTFIGQGKFKCNGNGLRIFYHVSEVTQKGGRTELEIMECLRNEEFRFPLIQ